MRKLAACAAAFSAAVCLSHYIIAHDRLLIAAAVSLALSFLGLLFHGSRRLRVLLAFIPLAAGFLWCCIFNAVFFLPYTQLHETEMFAEAVVTDYETQREPRGYRADAVFKLPGRPAAKIRLYYYTQHYLKPGDKIEFQAKLFRADLGSDGSSYDTLTSRGIFLTASIRGDIRITGTAGGAKYLPKQIAGQIAARIDELYPGDAADFLTALLTGMRGGLNRNEALQASLSASGIVHIVAISGMHVSFLVSFLGVFIKNKRLFAFYAIPAILFFMALTGFTPSVTRAGIMQIFLICAPLFRRESDSITSLMAAVTVLLIANPLSCASAGLQLSVAATLGIILLTSRINSAVSDYMHGKKINRNKAAAVIIRYIAANLATTAGALVFTIPLSAVHFGYVSLISPLTNLLTIAVVSVVFPLGMLTVIVSFASPGIAAAAALPVIWAVRYVIASARLLAAVPYSVVYTSNAHIMFWLAYVYILFAALAAFKARIKQYLYPVCISIILLFALILTSALVPAIPGQHVSVIDVGQGLSVYASAGGYNIVIDCGSISTNRAGAITHEYLASHGCTAVDLLILTHFHDDHVNGVPYLLSTINVKAIAIPDPEGSFIAEDIIELARERQTDIIYITQTMQITAGESSVYIYPPLGSGDENEQGLSVLINGSITALITGDMNQSVERALLRFAGLPKLDLLVAGHHGSRESTSIELLETLMPDITVIPVGRNSFGHPHAETLQRLECSGARVYRTDEEGTVVVRG